MTELSDKPPEFTMFLGAITGNALGTVFEGLPKQHIRSCIRQINEYTDPAPLLKGKMERWAKPGLYSCLTQMMIIAAVSHDGRLFRKDIFQDSISRSQSVHESDTGIFRHAGLTERNLIQRLKGENASERTPDYISGRVIPFSLALVPHNIDPVRDALNLALVFTKNPDTAAAVLLFSAGVRALLQNPSSRINQTFVNEAEDLLFKADLLSPVIFSMGLNPEAVISGIEWQKDTFQRIDGFSADEAEKIIRDRLNPLLKTPVTRATVDDPRCLLPFSIAISGCSTINPESIIVYSAIEGGSSSGLTMMCGALSGIIHGSSALPDFLVQGLVNRGRIIEIIDLISKGNGDRLSLDDFMKGEYSLTVKEQEELHARLKHIKKPAKPAREKTRQEKENALSRHTVESWTKMDKPKWKKDRQRKEQE